jgi:hypothetical protein
MRLPNKQIEIGRHEAGVGHPLARAGIAAPDESGKGSERVQSQGQCHLSKLLNLLSSVMSRKH